METNESPRLRALKGMTTLANRVSLRTLLKVMTPYTFVNQSLTNIPFPYAEAIAEAFGTIVRSKYYYKPLIGKVVRQLNLGINGIVFLVQLNTLDPNNYVIVKKQVNETSDPILYEYLVGRGVLNAIRFDDHQYIFALSLGMRIEGKTRLIFNEIVQWQKNTPRTLDLNTMIRLHTNEIDVINILIRLCMDLDFVHEKYGFTHYDLHPGNVMLHKRDDPKLIRITGTRVAKPFEYLEKHRAVIIDYGRCHVTLDKEQPFIDDVTGINYASAHDYQQKVWANTTAINTAAGITPDVLNHCKHLARNSLHLQNLSKLYGRRIKTYRDIFNLYKKLTKLHHGLYDYIFYLNTDPKVPHRIYDAFKLVMIISNAILHRGTPNRELWLRIVSKLENAFPLYIPGSYNCVMPSGMSADPNITTANDIAAVIIDAVQTIGYRQVGGGPAPQADDDWNDDKRRVYDAIVCTKCPGDAYRLLKIRYPDYRKLLHYLVPALKDVPEDRRDEFFDFFSKAVEVPTPEGDDQYHRQIMDSPMYKDGGPISTIKDFYERA